MAPRSEEPLQQTDVDEDRQFTLTHEEREAVVALKKACDDECVSYRSIFELAKYTLTVRSLVSDNANGAAERRTLLALNRIKKRRQWEAYHKIDQMDPQQTLLEVHKALPELFLVRYLHDLEGHIVVGHHIAHSPCNYMMESPENLGKYYAAEQWRMDLGAANLEEARRGIAIVAIAEGKWSLRVAYGYLRTLTKASDNAKDMHPNRLRRVYAEVPTLFQHLIEVGKKLLPRKIADRVNVHSTLNELEQNLCKAPHDLTVTEWCQQRNAIYTESVEKVKL